MDPMALKLQLKTSLALTPQVLKKMSRGSQDAWKSVKSSFIHNSNTTLACYVKDQGWMLYWTGLTTSLKMFLGTAKRSCRPWKCRKSSSKTQWEHLTSPKNLIKKAGRRQRNTQLRTPRIQTSPITFALHLTMNWRRWMHSSGRCHCNMVLPRKNGITWRIVRFPRSTRAQPPKTCDLLCSWTPNTT